MFLHHFHGAASRVQPTATAFALRRDHLLVELVAAWPSDQPADDREGEQHRAWLRGLTDALQPFTLPGGYPNLLGPDERDRAMTAYGRNAERLVQLKRRYDPDNVFSAVPALLPAPQT